MNVNKRFYLDYNATAPIDEKFIIDLKAGEIPFANPSSIHQQGKAAGKYISECKKELYEHFHLKPSDYEILFHSGATEASQLFLNLTTEDCLIYFNSDHACVTNLAKYLSGKSISTFGFDLDKTGAFAIDEVIHKIKTYQEQNKTVWLCFTPLNNETGVVWDLAIAQKIKEQTGCLVYVDAVQTVGKMSEYDQLDGALDVYTFSGHKFGALKGVGFSFYKKNLNITPLFFGGGQQLGLRPGTINITGIASLVYGLRAVEEKQMQEVSLLKDSIVNLFNQKSQIKLIENKSLNTICFVHKKMQADLMLIHFDMAGLEVSSGSACSSGSVEPSGVLQAMGLTDWAKAGIRISLGKENIKDSDVIIKKLKMVLEKL